MNKIIKNLIKKTDLNENLIIRLLAEEQLYKNHYKNLVDFEMNFTPKSRKFIETLAKKLKISTDSVVSVLLQMYFNDNDRTT